MINQDNSKKVFWRRLTAKLFSDVGAENPLAGKDG
jgi:hypothetical protein